VELGLPPTPDHFSEQYRLIAGDVSPRARPNGQAQPPAAPDKPARELLEMVLSAVQMATDTTLGLSDNVGRASVDVVRYLDVVEEVRERDALARLLAQVVETVSSLKSAVDVSRRELDDAKSMLADMKSELEQNRMLIHTDPLTGVSNRRGLDLALMREIARSRRMGAKLSVGIIDIDCFKTINDRYGHQCGDQALIHLAAVAKGGIRKYDLVARYGGEEFLVVLPDTDIRGAWFVVDRLRAMIEKTPFRYQKEALQLTFSAGVTEMTGDDTVESLISRADRLMYEAKGAGRNRVMPPLAEHA
jgi:diguanylate cyclase